MPVLSIPPPNAFPKPPNSAVLSLTVVFSSVSVPALKIPPPEDAELPLTVVSSTVSVPLL